MNAVIFDCDGVLVDSEIIAVRAELRALKVLGLQYDEDEYVHRHLGTTVDAFFSALDADHQETFGTPLPDGFADRLLQETKDEMDATLEAIPGVHDAVAAISRPAAMASSSGLKRLHFKLKKTNLHTAFDPHIYSGEQVKNGKPEPDLFLFAAEKLGIPTPACVAIEDSVNGVKSAKAAGMTVIGFTGGSHCLLGHNGYLADAGAVMVINHMDLLKDALASIN